MASTNPPERGKTSLDLLFPSALSGGYTGCTTASFLSLPSKRTSTGFPLEPLGTVRITLPVYSQACGANFSSSKMHGQIPPSLIRDQVSRLKLRTRVGSAGRVNRKKKEKEKEASLARSNPSLQRVIAMEVAREERERAEEEERGGGASLHMHVPSRQHWRLGGHR